MLAAEAPHIEVWESHLPAGATTYPSMTNDLPSVHWFERFIYDLFGLLPEGHPRFKSVIFHAAWPEDFFPLSGVEDITPTANEKKRDYGFLPVRGEGVFEIAVGPIHAGIIEAGHFRFSCIGEEIQNLDIRLGYLHRGIERRLEGVSLVRAQYLAESASTDTKVGNALAHALAIENLLGYAPDTQTSELRAVALELERTANHVGDLGAICGDMGFQAGAASFARMRARVLGISERLTGSRFMTAYIRPGGVSRIPNETCCREISQEVEELLESFTKTEPVLFENHGALDRLEGLGVLKPSLADDLGIVGPTGRASGVRYDVRQWFGQSPYIEHGWSPAYADEGDVFARLRIRASEITESLKLSGKVLSKLGTDKRLTSCNADLANVALPPNRVGIGIVEAWRGELIHTIFTDPDGNICRYAIKDPSTNNWTGLAHVVRGELVSDFPICNKSFSLSYSGNDL
jgi:Ni,Fe-hydrogenase III large subunit